MAPPVVSESSSPRSDGRVPTEEPSAKPADENGDARKRAAERRRSPRGERRRRRRSGSESRRRSRRDGSGERRRRRRSRSAEAAREPSPEPVAKKPKMDTLQTRTGGAYIPPAKLKMMQEQIADKNSEQYQRLAWERLKKKIHGHVNKINVGNLVSTVQQLLQENIVRGKGLIARSIIQAQAFSPTFSHVYAALVAVINSKVGGGATATEESGAVQFPHVGELVLRRLIIQFKRSFRRNDKQTAITVTKFLAHLINQQVVRPSPSATAEAKAECLQAHEVLSLEVLTLLLEEPTDDSVEVAIAFLKECGMKLSEVTPRGISAIYDRLRSILNESEIDKRVQYMIEVAFHIRKDKFSAHPAVMEDLDLIEEDDQITHTITLEDAVDPENMLNVFRLDVDFEKNEQMYEEIKKEILGGGSDDDSGAEEGDDDDDDGDETKTQTIVDQTETNLVDFRRTVYLTIQSSLDYQEAAHKLLKMDVKPGLEVELCHMLVDCCAQQRTYEKFYGLLVERFCRLRKEFQQYFEQIFKDSYNTIHRFEITKLRNTTKLCAHLLFTDAMSWEVLAVIRMNEDDTTSSSRIFIKVLFLELVEYMGLETLFERIRDPTMQTAFEGLFPRDNPRDTRFAINFFTSIGLGGLTVDLREHLKSGPKQIVNLPADSAAPTVKREDGDSGDADDSSSDDSSSDDSDSSSSESSTDAEEEKAQLQSRIAERDRQREQRASPRARRSPPPPPRADDRGRVDRRGRPEPAEGDRRPPVERRRSPARSPPPVRRRSPPRSTAQQRRRSPAGSPPPPPRRRSPAGSPPPPRRRSPARSPKPERRRSPPRSPPRDGRRRERQQSGSPPRRRR